MKLVKALFFIVIVQYAILGVGVLQQHNETSATSKCTKESSAKHYWYIECPTGRSYYEIKTDSEVDKYLRGK